jgi:hypothetical protein
LQTPPPKGDRRAGEKYKILHPIRQSLPPLKRGILGQSSLAGGQIKGKNKSKSVIKIKK